MGLVLITHDMGVVAETADRVVVQYAAGRSRPTKRARCSPTRIIPILPPARRRCPSAPRGPAAVHRRRRAGPVRPAERLPLFAALRLRFNRCRRRRRFAPRRRLGAGALLHATGQRACREGAIAMRSDAPPPPLTPPPAAPHDCRARSRASLTRQYVGRARLFSPPATRQGARRAFRSSSRPDERSRWSENRLRQIDARAASRADREADRGRADHRRRGCREADARRPATAARKSRSCSRIPTVRSIRARRSARRSRSRCSSTRR